MTTFLPALTQSLIFYMVMALSYFGWGWAASRILMRKEQPLQYRTSLIWLGWAFTLFIIELLHFFLSITAYVVVPVFILGILLLFGHGAKMPQFQHPKDGRGLAFAAVCFGMLVLAVWIASRSMLSPTNGDSGLYHFNAIRWINSFPIVLGLGNLHGRLAFNQTFFLYVAALNLFPFFEQGRSIANSFLFLLTAATLVDYLWLAFQQPAALAKIHPFKFAPSMFGLVFLGYLALTTDGLASPEPDLTSTLLQLTMFVVLADCVAEWLNSQRNLNNQAMFIVVLAATSVTIKLSNLAFGAVMMLFVLAYIWQTFKQRAERILRMFAPAAIMILIWCLRGFLLSGAPVYPSTIGYVPVSWAVPRQQVVDDANWIYSWARQPHTDFTQVLGNSNWFTPWLKGQLQEKADFLIPLLLASVFLASTMVLFFLSKAARPHLLEWAILAPVILPLLFWFFTAPETRFANALFFLIALSMILLFLVSIHKYASPRIFVVVFWITFVVGNLHFAGHALNHLSTIKDISVSGYQAVTVVPLDTVLTNSGLAVLTPAISDQCWDAPLPCTPNFTPNLALREIGNLGSGFINRQTK